MQIMKYDFPIRYIVAIVVSFRISCNAFIILTAEKVLTSNTIFSLLFSILLVLFRFPLKIECISN